VIQVHNIDNMTGNAAAADRSACANSGPEVCSVSFRIALIVSVLLPLLTTGCGQGPEAQFVYNERTDGLIPEGRDAIQQKIRDGFGTPKDMVAWLKLPVDFGRADGQVAPSEADASGTKVRSFQAALSGEVPANLAGAGLLWTSGEYAGQVLHVTSYDADSHRLNLAEYMEPPPEPGDKFAVVGAVLQSGRKLYMTHCLHCHGVSGDGNGPTAKYLNPLPRDYRLGKFKFTSTNQTGKVSRDDLARILKHGIPGTYMPSFMLLEPDELTAIVEYVRWLAMRGELENKLDAELEADYSAEVVERRIADGEGNEAIVAELQQTIEGDFPETVEDLATDLADAWSGPQEDPSLLIVPQTKRGPGDIGSLARGRALFLSGKAKCVTCHGVTGVGDGPQVEDIQKNLVTGKEYPEPGLYDDWGNKIKPRNLKRGIYRGGRRPLDLYRRIYAGIKGTPMPAFGGTVLNDDEIWDLVNYVMSIPFGNAVETTEEPPQHATQSSGHPQSG
jgi:mono/diheme cytochrome c family protein